MSPLRRGVRLPGVLVGLLVAAACIVALWLLLRDSNDAKEGAQQESEVATTISAAALDLLDAQCEAGIESSCAQLDELRDLLAQADTDTPEAVEDPEVQEPEIQEPEIQDGDPDDPERQDPERQEAEQQNPERQDPELGDDEIQDEESDDPEVQDPEIQEPEQQDPEIDDPDPNSALTFEARDDCSPPAGEVITDTGLAVERGDGVVTYVLTCTSATPDSFGPYPPARSGTATP